MISSLKKMYMWLSTPFQTKSQYGAPLVTPMTVLGIGPVFVLLTNLPFSKNTITLPEILIGFSTSIGFLLILVFWEWYKKNRNM